MFALGQGRLYHRPTEGTINFLTTKFASKPDIRDANITAFKVGYAFGETTEVLLRVFRHLRGGAGAHAAREVLADLGQPRAGVRADHRIEEGRLAAVPRVLSDHARIRRTA